jgi:hypothetical protein
VVHFIRGVASTTVLNCSLVAPLLAQASWQIAYPSSSPPPAYQWAAAFDELHGEAILMFPRAVSSQGWRWNGTSWAQLAGPLPPSRIESYMVWDDAHQRVVLFGGFVSSTSAFLQDLWEWNGTSWQQHVAAMPPGRSGAAVAYDRARGVTVMFGGSGPLDDTWEWNGTSWTSVSAALRPSPREGAMMAFDPNTQRLLLYGGVSAGQVHNSDTWTWNGSQWQQQVAGASPFQRDRGIMVSDLTRSRVVLYGGSTYDIETWEWDGVQWHVSIPASPGAWQGSAGVYDTQRREVLLHGGTNPNWISMNQTWRYRTATPATSAPFGAGCAGSAGVPVLANAPYTLPWIGDTARNRVDVVVGQLGALFASSFGSLSAPIDLGPVGMPGCSLLVPADVVEFSNAQASVAEWSVAIPNSTSFVGMPIRQQAFPLDLAANALGLVASNGIVMTPGIR